MRWDTIGQDGMGKEGMGLDWDKMGKRAVGWGRTPRGLAIRYDIA